MQVPYAGAIFCPAVFCSISSASWSTDRIAARNSHPHTHGWLDMIEMPVFRLNTVIVRDNDDIPRPTSPTSWLSKRAIKHKTLKTYNSCFNCEHCIIVAIKVNRTLHT